jgi:signal transduction histidine kinase
MEHQPRIVIGPDGTVLAASGNLPPGLIDTRLVECTALPSSLREAGLNLLDQLRASGNRVVCQTVELDPAQPAVQLVAIEALAVRRRATDLGQLLGSKLAVISSQANAAGIALSVEIADDVPAVVRLDSDKVSWAVTTLVGNALRYVQTPSRRLGGKTIRVLTRFDRSSSEITIAVQDDGPGIPADTVERLFLGSGGVNARGSGLALLLVRDIVVAHGGRVDLQSKTDPIGHGTTIRLTFPTR